MSEIDLLEILKKASAFCYALDDVVAREEVELPEDLLQELPKVNDALIDGIQHILRRRDDRGLPD
jgi:hypothetical protein